MEHEQVSVQTSLPLSSHSCNTVLNMPHHICGCVSEVHALRFLKHLCPVLASQCEVTGLLSRENHLESYGSAAKEFQSSTNGLFLQPSVVCPSLA